MSFLEVVVVVVDVTLNTRLLVDVKGFTDKGIFGEIAEAEVVMVGGVVFLMLLLTMMLVSCPHL